MRILAHLDMLLPIDNGVIHFEVKSMKPCYPVFVLIALTGCAGNPWLMPEEKPLPRPLSFPQAVSVATPPMVMVTEIHTDPVFQIKLQGKWSPLKNHEDFVMQSGRKKSQAQLHDSGWVFAGYGVTVPALGWDNYRNLDVVGKTVVVLSGAPSIPEGALVDSRTLILHPVSPNLGQWQTKVKNAERHGAALVLLIQDTQKDGWGGVLDFPNAVLGAPQDSSLMAWGWINELRFKNWLAKSGVNWERLKSKAQVTDFVGVSLPIQTGLTLQNRWREVELQPGG